MRKRGSQNIILAVFCLAAVLAGLFPAVCLLAADNEPSDKKSETGRIGGGYAATSQIPGAYFLPVLYDAENGLPTSEANCILADSEGYIWIGGYSGIIRYDGVHFERLPISGGLTSGRSLFEDSRGRIFVATNDNGVVILDDQETTQLKKADGLGSDSIRSFAEDAGGNVFIGSTAGLNYLDREMKLHKINDERINHERVLRLVTDADGMVYGQTSAGAVFAVSAQGIRYFFTSDELSMEKITTILADPTEPGMLYFGTNANCIYYGKFGDAASQMKKIRTDAAENIHWMHFSCGRLWACSTHIAGYVDENDVFVPFLSLPVKDAFEMMTTDFQGNIWFASSRYGVMKLVADNFLDITGAAGISPEVVNATCKWGEDLYVGTDNGLRIIDKDYDSRNNYITDYFKTDRIRCILEDREGNLWFGTFSERRALVRLDPDQNLKSFTADDGLPGNEVRCMLELSDGRLAVGTSSGVAVLKDGAVTERYGSSQGLNNTVILTLCEGEKGTILAGTDGDGIYVLQDGVVKERIGAEAGLGSDVIMRLKKDPRRGVTWAITSNCVDYLKNGAVTTVTTFPYNNNFDVLFGRKDDLWFLSSQGIYVVDAQDALSDSITDYRLFDRSNGLTTIPISHCYSGSGEDGMVYIAGQTGVSAVNIQSLCDFSGNTRLGVRSVLYNGAEILPDKDGVYTLPAERGRVQINPAILDYTITNPMVRVYMNGMDDEGLSAKQTDLMPLEYTRLRYGNYDLHIQLMDQKTGSVTREQVIRIVKKPGFFERSSVRILMMILALSAIGIIVWRIMTDTVIRKQYIEIQKARDEAQRANSAKSRFLANMSHEIRTPINTILGMDEMILREDTRDVPRSYFGPVTGYARDIKYASESLLNLINDLLDVSKIEAGKMHLVEQEYDTTELFRSVISMIRVRAEEKKLYFDVKIDENLPKRLYGDGGKIKQVLLNMLTNAVKYTDEGGFTLFVRVTDHNEAGLALRISVRDTGIGVRAEDIEKLFYAYERLDEVKNSNIQGTGLGLDISRQFAEMMGGKLWCESIYGEGSEFILTCKQKIADNTPIGVFYEERDEAEPGVYKPSFIAPDADILVVDDNPMNLSVIKGLLRPTRVFVTTAASGEECLEKIAADSFNVVLLDHMMPGMDGIETMAKIREIRPDLPVYALTANATAGGEEFYRSKGFDGYLTKPVDIIAVEHAIMRHLPESMMEIPTEEDTVAEDQTLSEEYSWLDEAEGINAEEGIKNAGGASRYVFTLRLFKDAIADTADAIEKAYREGDLRLATVKVHALKTSARIIGADRLSKDCQALEDAGNAKDLAYIDANRDRVLADYRAYETILSPLDEEEKKEDKQEISEEMMEDAIMALTDCVSQMDYDAVEMIVKDLDGYTLFEPYASWMVSFEKSFRAMDWEQMEALISDLSG